MQKFSLPLQTLGLLQGRRSCRQKTQVNWCWDSFEPNFHYPKTTSLKVYQCEKFDPRYTIRYTFLKWGVNSYSPRKATAHRIWNFFNGWRTAKSLDDSSLAQRRWLPSDCQPWRYNRSPSKAVTALKRTFNSSSSAAQRVIVVINTASFSRSE